MEYFFGKELHIKANIINNSPVTLKNLKVAS